MALDVTVSGTASDSYATLAEYQARAVQFGWTLVGVDADDEVNLRKAAVALDNMYRWIGTRAEELQSREWARDIDGYVEGYSIGSAEIPNDIKLAQMELAFLIQGGADPLATLSGGTIKRKREKVDVIEEETEYMDGGARERNAYPLIDSLVSPYALGKQGQKTGSISLGRA